MHRRDGFTLIEMSVVLVVIGFLVGGILAGQELIKNNQLKSIVVDLSRYDIALNSFREKYQALPGDMPGATGIWGSAGGNGSIADPGCQNIVGANTATCNGNGDFTLQSNSTTMGESYRAWQHLQNGGFVEGAFTGTVNGLTLSELPKALPSSKLRRNGYQFYTESRSICWINPPEGNQPNLVLYIAAPVPADSSLPIRLGTYSLSPFEAYTIDLKLDNAKPGTGRIYTAGGGSGGVSDCTTTTDPTTADYNSAANGDNCYLHYVMQ